MKKIITALILSCVGTLALADDSITTKINACESVNLVWVKTMLFPNSFEHLYKVVSGYDKDSIITYEQTYSQGDYRTQFSMQNGTCTVSIETVRLETKEIKEVFKADTDWYIIQKGNAKYVEINKYETSSLIWYSDSLRDVKDYFRTKNKENEYQSAMP
jgi:hypothetical protein